MGDIVHDMGWDGVEFRMKNAIAPGYVDEFSPSNTISYRTDGLRACVERGKQLIGWDEKRREYAHQDGPIRHGVGVAFLVYKTAVAPFALETSNCQITLNQDGTFQLQMGATEIGQGADTVFCQMAAEAIGVRTEDIHIVSTQDTDVAPYDPGAYASRQTFVSGAACKDAGQKMRGRILELAARLYPDYQGELDLRDHAVWDAAGNKVVDLPELALEAYYNLHKTDQISTRGQATVHQNALVTGCTFCDVTVDMPLAQVTVNKIVSVQDNGRLMNPKLVEQQMHGGMAQSIGFALSEELLVDPATGRVRNATLLDYKVPTAMDVPELIAENVETQDPMGPYGNKAVGETPIISPAPAIRDAILNATGVKFYEMPMTPQRLFEGFKREGLI